MSKSNGPFRRWLGKLGLVSDSSEEQIPTAELPDLPSATQPEPEPKPEPELLSKQELEVSTADTRPLPPELAETPASIESKADEQQMESNDAPMGNQTGDLSHGSGPLLDLGDFEPARAAAEEDFVLDIDFDDSAERQAPVVSSGVSASFNAQESARVNGVESVAIDDYQEAPGRRGDADRATEVDGLALTADPMATTQEMSRPVMAGEAHASERAFAEPEIFEGEAVRMVSEPARSGQITLEQLSPEAVDAIARRAVEMLSERVVQEIAWEVVPQLAELLIKRQLEEKNS